MMELHFWLATLGVVLYISSMWIAGVMQGLMWRATAPDGTLTYSFVEAVKATYPFYTIRMVGGLFFLAGMLVMAWNTWLTMKGEVKVNPTVPLMNPDARDPALLGPASTTA
jgi:cytochrome c oxidase cbb3-type subunit 1